MEYETVNVLALHKMSKMVKKWQFLARQTTIYGGMGVLVIDN